MKKIVTMLLVCVMVLGLFAGCGNGSTQQTTAPAATTAAASGETEALVCRLRNRSAGHALAALTRSRRLELLEVPT